MAVGKLFLVPNTLGYWDAAAVLSESVRQKVQAIEYWLVENPKNAEKFFNRIGLQQNQNIHINILNKETPQDTIFPLLHPLTNGSDIGILSESGYPCIADPGALAVQETHRLGADVVPLPGASSLFLALAASGLNGQHFAFEGYLPIEKKKRSLRLQELCLLIRKSSQTQIFIEAPHRNQDLFQSLTQECPKDFLLCIARSLTLPDEWIRTKTIQEWKVCSLQWNKVPCVFILGL